MSIPFGVLNPFIDHLGFTLERFESGESEVHYEARPEHLNCFAVIHGGATMTLMDVVTIEMKTSFMQAARGRLTARGRLIHRTATLAFTEATVFDAAGKPCSHATGTFKYVRRLTEGPEDNQALNVISTN
jgi:acyl-coenzyme A thioesterase PaaI-like protein